jgi:hypothetical protein
MSAFGGRRAPNVSQYVANLNTIPSAHDVATQQQEGFSLEDDLAMFTNTEFFDFDLGENTLAAPLEYDPLQEERARRENAAAQQKNLKGRFEWYASIRYYVCLYLLSSSARVSAVVASFRIFHCGSYHFLTLAASS